MLLFFIDGYPSFPIITSTLFESNSITINWKMDDTAERYEIQYNFTIRECTSIMSTQSRQVNTTNKTNFTLRERIEEDSDYYISLTAVNSNGSSQADVITNKTKEAGT